ncbi:hypothetical protein KQI65_00280 [bacterium]|nr:hypothetical protein [bacterium]
MPQSLQVSNDMLEQMKVGRVAHVEEQFQITNIKLQISNKPGAGIAFHDVYSEICVQRESNL